MTDEQIARDLELAKKATPRPWRVVGNRHVTRDTISSAGIDEYAIAVHHPNGPWEAVFAYQQADAAYIVAACNNYPAALEELKEARKPCVWTKVATGLQPSCGGRGSTTWSVTYPTFCPHCGHKVEVQGKPK